MLEQADRDYLKSRGYTDQLLEHEGWFSVTAGVYKEYGLEVPVPSALAGVLLKTPSGKVTALQTVNIHEKAYRKFRTEAGEYLPVYLASTDDFELWESTQEVVLVEGVFDRVAVKRCQIPAACFALLGLGVSYKTARHLARYSKRVWVMVDRDEHGEKASERILNVLRANNVACEVIPYAEHDPGDWLMKRGVVRMKRELEREMELRGWG